ncbi:hypothetical protein [Roseiterribacter gracilis]|uniref:Uncharacterized protein n=1 Tax=Roseiterribacter gracilis TaxID=2812848 RepID=A0A8S8XEJ6_9PROT|nr:hypothetical protein TMPK1_17570 [Rhodospirillales bacterium TMPK1]
MQSCLRFSAFLLAALVFFGGPARAATLPAPADSYAADVALDVGSTHLPGTVRHDRGRELRTIDTNYGRQTFLVRPDRGRAWLLQAGFGVALEVELNAPELGVDLNRLYRIEATPRGRETIAGLPVTRYRLAGEVVKNSRFEGDVWATDSGILVKIDGTATDAGRAQPVRMLLANIKRGPQDPNLFEVPANMNVMKVDGAMREMLRGLGR